MGFEGKSRPVLQAIMDRHGLSPASPSQKLTAEGMRRRLMSHIMLGECHSRNLAVATVPLSQLQCPALRRNVEGEEFTCKDFVHVAGVSGELLDCDKEVAVFNIALQKIRSRKTLLRLLQCKEIHYNVADNVKHLRIALKRHIRSLENRKSNHPSPQLRIESCSEVESN